MSFNPKLLEETLICTKCRSGLVLKDNALFCVSPACRMKYAIIHDIPDMLIDDACIAATEDWSAAMHRSGRDPGTGMKTENG
jgi:uncharacterized protein YbaR (Trm112 family)